MNGFLFLIKVFDKIFSIGVFWCNLAFCDPPPPLLRLFFSPAFQISPATAAPSIRLKNIQLLFCLCMHSVCSAVPRPYKITAISYCLNHQINLATNAVTMTASAWVITVWTPLCGEQVESAPWSDIFKPVKLSYSPIRWGPGQRYCFRLSFFCQHIYF